MMKNDVKKNALLTTAAVAGLTLAGGVNVHADQVNSANNDAPAQSEASATSEQQAQARVDQAQTNVNNAQAAVDNANTQVNNAQSAFNAASDAQSKQQANVNTASDATKQAQEVVNADQAKVNSASTVASSATPENIQKAKDAIENQNTTINNDSNAISDAQKAASSASQSFTTASDAVKQASTNVNVKQNEVNTASDSVKAASDALKGTGLAQAQDKYNQASTAADNAQSAVNSQDAIVNQATTAASDATKAASQAASNLSQANSAVNADNSDVTAKSATASQTKSAKDNAQQAVDATSKQISDVNNKIKGYADNKITVNQATVDAYNAYNDAFDTYYKNKTQANETAKDNALKNFYTVLHENGKINSYQSSTSEKDEMVDMNNLTTAQLNEINDFAAKLINQVREDWGTASKYGLVTPTTGMQSFANEIAKKYEEQNWSNGHNVPVIEQTAKEYGLLDSDNYYEDLSLGEMISFDGSGKISMDELKEGIYNTINDMLFFDDNSGNGHMSSLIGEMTGNPEGNYLGVAVDALGNVSGQVHIEMVPENTEFSRYITNESLFNSKGGKTEIKYTDPRTVLQNQLNDLNNTLSQQQTTLTNAKNADDAAQSALSQAQAKLQNDQKTAESAKKANDDAQQDLATKEHTLSEEQNKLGNLNALLVVAQNNKAAAKKTLDNFNADQQTKLQAYQKAQTSLANAQKELQSAKDAEQSAINKLNQAKSVLDQKNQAVKDAQAKKSQDEANLTKLQQNLTDLQNAPKLLASAKEQLNKDQAALDTAKQNLKKQQDLLTPLVEATNAAQKNLDAAKKVQASATENLASAKSELDAALNALWTDAKKYGKVVSVNPITVTAGQNVPEPTLANKTFKESTNTAAQQLFTQLAVMPNADENAIPEGTTAQWVNSAKVQADAQTVGTYTEDVLVTFPDGTTVTVKATLTVTPVANGGTKPTVTLPNGYKISGNHVVDAQGNIVAGWTVQNGQAVPVVTLAKGNTVSPTLGAAKNTSSTSASRQANKQANLPQTSDNKQEGALLSLLGASLLGVLGFASKKKEY